MVGEYAQALAALEEPHNRNFKKPQRHKRERLSSLHKTTQGKD